VTNARTTSRREHRSEQGRREVGELVYFRLTLDDHIRIGHAEDGRKRGRTHANEGMEFIAGLPGSYDAEKDIHSYFEEHLVPGRGRSTYFAEPILPYISWLLRRGFAADDEDEALILDPLPFHVWNPRRLGEHPDENGQGYLWDRLPVRDRIAALRADLPHLSSASDEWLTPPHVIDLVRDVFGGVIGTDPASNREAQEWIQADTYYTKERDGLSLELPWHGGTWLNPPYGRGGAAKFVGRLVVEINQGHVTQAITCLNLNSAAAHWFDQVWHAAAVHLVWRGRIDFIKRGEDRDTSPSKGTILSYFGQEPDRFAPIFGPHGAVLNRRNV
jgi:hypothetical protein